MYNRESSDSRMQLCSPQSSSVMRSPSSNSHSGASLHLHAPSSLARLSISPSTVSGSNTSAAPGTTNKSAPSPRSSSKLKMGSSGISGGGVSVSGAPSSPIHSATPRRSKQPPALSSTWSPPPPVALSGASAPPPRMSSTPTHRSSGGSSGAASGSSAMPSSSSLLRSPGISASSAASAATRKKPDSNSSVAFGATTSSTVGDSKRPRLLAGSGTGGGAGARVFTFKGAPTHTKGPKEKKEETLFSPQYELNMDEKEAKEAKMRGVSHHLHPPVHTHVHGHSSSHGGHVGAHPSHAGALVSAELAKENKRLTPTSAAAAAAAAQAAANSATAMSVAPKVKRGASLGNTSTQPSSVATAYSRSTSSTATSGRVPSVVSSPQSVANRQATAPPNSALSSALAQQQQQHISAYSSSTINALSSLSLHSSVAGGGVSAVGPSSVAAVNGTGRYLHLSAYQSTTNQPSAVSAPVGVGSSTSNGGQSQPPRHYSVSAAAVTHNQPSLGHSPSAVPSVAVSTTISPARSAPAPRTPSTPIASATQSSYASSGSPSLSLSALSSSPAGSSVSSAIMARYQAARPSPVRASPQATNGDNVDEMDMSAEEEEDEFDPFLFIKNLPPLTKDLQAGVLHPLPKRLSSDPPITLALDLDETLVHCSVEPLEKAELRFQVNFNGIDYEVFVRKRPHLMKFLKAVSQWFEVIVFTASQKVYADKLLNILDPNRQFIRHRVFRDSCVCVDGNYLKDLTVLDRDLQRLVIVDNSPQAFGFHVDNGIPIESWFDDDHDTELLNLLPFLEVLKGVQDVRPLVRDTFKLREFVDSL